MSQPTGIASFTLAAASANNIALSQTPGAAGPITLNGAAVSAGVAVLDRQRRVIITSAGDDTAKTFTITGTNQSGAIISEVLAGANAGAAVSQRDYLKITSIVASAATTAITVGTNGVGSTQWFKLDLNRKVFAVSIADILLSGAINDTVEYTYDNVDDTTVVPAVFSLAAMTGYSATKDGTLGPGPVPSVRVTRNSGTGASRIVIVQQGI